MLLLMTVTFSLRALLMAENCTLVAFWTTEACSIFLATSCMAELTLSDIPLMEIDMLSVAERRSLAMPTMLSLKPSLITWIVPPRSCFTDSMISESLWVAPPICSAIAFRFCVKS